MMLSLSSFLRLIFACRVAAILHKRETRAHNVNTKEISTPHSPKSNSCSFDLDKNEINSEKLQPIFKFNYHLRA